jgi:hypothetical protein
MNSAMKNLFSKATLTLDGFDIQNNRPNEENVCLKYHVHPTEVYDSCVTCIYSCASIWFPLRSAETYCHMFEKSDISSHLISLGRN